MYQAFETATGITKSFYRSYFLYSDCFIGPASLLKIR